MSSDKLNEKRKIDYDKTCNNYRCKDYVGQEVTIGAWVANKSGKGKIAFLQLRDGTAFFQGVAFQTKLCRKIW